MGTLTPAGYFWASLGSSLANVALLALGGLLFVKWVRPWIARRLAAGRSSSSSSSIDPMAPFASVAPEPRCKLCEQHLQPRLFCPTCNRCCSLEGTECEHGPDRIDRVATPVQ
jgi:hypothetical protein